MDWVGKIQQAIGYIEEHLADDLSMESVGRAINYAPSSFQHLFSAMTGYSIGEYIRFRRLSCAMEEIINDDCSITETAFKYGYETVEAFTKAVKRLYGCPPSKLSRTNPHYHKFDPILIEYKVHGGFHMAKNFIPNMARVGWSDGQRQNEFVWSVISALGAIGERRDYDEVCAISGSAFRTSFSREGWNHGNYHVINAPCTIGHTFQMLGYRATHHVRGDYETDRRLIMDSVDKGVPVVTLEGVINCADACVISGYDMDGDVLLGYSPFMDIPDDHDEPHDETGYFRKSGWHEGFSAGGSRLRILVIDGTCEKPPAEELLHETLKLAVSLIETDSLAPGQHNGLAAHRAFADALLTYGWEDNFEPYLNVMCNFKQYRDKQYAAGFLANNGRKDLAAYYERIAGLTDALARIIPQDFTAAELFGDKARLRPFAETLLQISDLEQEFAAATRRSLR